MVPLGDDLGLLVVDGGRLVVEIHCSENRVSPSLCPRRLVPRVHVGGGHGEVGKESHEVLEHEPKLYFCREACELKNCFTSTLQDYIISRAVKSSYFLTLFV